MLAGDCQLTVATQAAPNHKHWIIDEHSLHSPDVRWQTRQRSTKWTRPRRRRSFVETCKHVCCNKHTLLPTTKRVKFLSDIIQVWSILVGLGERRNTSTTQTRNEHTIVQVKRQVVFHSLRKEEHTEMTEIDSELGCCDHTRNSAGCRLNSDQTAYKSVLYIQSNFGKFRYNLVANCLLM